MSRNLRKLRPALEVEGEDVRSATLDGLLARLRHDAEDPVLRRKLDLAFDKHRGALRTLVRRELPGQPEELIEETVQDALLVAWNKLPTHDGRYFRAWLFAIATLGAVHRWRGWIEPTDHLVIPVRGAGRGCG